MKRITNVLLPQPLNQDSKEKKWSVLVDEKGIIRSLQEMPEGSRFVGDDWQGDFLSPRAIDLQINGGLGIAFPSLTFHELPKLYDLLDRLWLDGVEAICPTFVSCSKTSLRLAFTVLREARKFHKSNRCELLGAHLEGPFLSNEFVGAHHMNCLLKPTLSAVEQLIGGFEDDIRMVTLAPELDGSAEVIKYLKNIGVIVCLGHSAADFEQSSQSFDQGVEMLTHSFNAMPGLHHRELGPIGAAIKNGGIFMGLIADGIHLHPDMTVFMQKLAPSQLVLVSDALSPYGMKEGHYLWDGRDIFVKKGVCRLKDGTLAGVTLPLLDTCKRLAKWSGQPSAAIWSATIAPRHVFNKKTTEMNFFIGKSLKKLLRWHLNAQNRELSWQAAS